MPDKITLAVNFEVEEILQDMDKRGYDISSTQLEAVLPLYRDDILKNMKESALDYIEYALEKEGWM